MHPSNLLPALNVADDENLLQRHVVTTHLPTAFFYHLRPTNFCRLASFQA